LTADEAAAKASHAPWNDDEERYWTTEYSKRYKGATLAFMQTVLSGGTLFSIPDLSVTFNLTDHPSDPEGFYAILWHVPWHADTLLQLAELYSHREGQPFDSTDLRLIVECP